MSGAREMFDSDEEDDDLQYVGDITPYQFEPEYSAEQAAARASEVKRAESDFHGRLTADLQSWYVARSLTS